MLPYRGQASELRKINQHLKQFELKMNDVKHKQRVAKATKVEMEKLIYKTKAHMQDVLAQIYKQTDEMVKISHKIDITEMNLAETGMKLKKVNKRIKVREKLKDGRIRLMYTNGFVSYMDVLANVSSLPDFLDRLDSLQAIVAQDKKLLEEHKQDQQLAVKQKAQIETNLKQVKFLYAELNNTKRKLLQKEQEKKSLIVNYHKQINDLDEATEEQQRSLVQFAKQRAALLQKKRKLLQPKTTNRKLKKRTAGRYTGGRLGLPLHSHYYVSSPFGGRVDPMTGRRGAFHSGMDMATSKGTSIYAAEAGTVIMAEWWSGYGNCIIIDHGNELWTLYGHIRHKGIKVKKGDIVARGDEIAEVGATGLATGNHLHFEVRVNGKCVNPAVYLK